MAPKLQRTADNIIFASKAEMHRYLELKGKVKGLILQPKFELLPKTGQFRKVSYIADFQYEEGDTIVVEDVKGMELPLWKLKAHLFVMKYPQYIYRVIK